VTPALIRYHEHRRDEVAAAFRSAYGRAAEEYERRPALTAASAGHVAVLRQRGLLVAEGGEELQAALQRFRDSAGVLREGLQEADRIAEAADAALEQLRSAPWLAAVEAEGGPMSLTTVNSWVIGRMSAAMGSEPLDAVSGRRIEAKGRRR
jgi:hypothetical protein